MEQIDVYRVVRELGRGGAAIVYEVLDPQGQAWALKLLLRSGPRNLARFERELGAMTSLGAQGGFVPVLNAGQCPRGSFIVMPLLRGGTLEERLRQGPLPILDVIDLGESLAGALASAHELGLVHRDLKPANVLFDGVGRALIADLGLAKAMDESQDASLSKTGELRGTLGYAPPEQLRDAKRAGPPADVFSLGATLYHCLAGRSPFGQDLAALEKIESGIVPPLASQRPDTPAWLIAVLQRCLRTDPSERYADGGALAEAFAAASSVPAPRGKGAWLLAALGIVAALVAGGAWALSRAPEPRPKATSPAASLATSPLADPSPELPPAPDQSSNLTRDLGSFTSFLPLSQLGGLEEVQGGRILRVRPTPTGGLSVADEFGFLRVFRGPTFEPQGWLTIFKADERFAPLPKGVPRVLEISPTGNYALATIDAQTAVLRSLDKNGTRLLLERLPSPLLAGAFSQDGSNLFLALGRRVVRFDLVGRTNSPLVTRARPVRQLATGPQSEFAIATEDGAVEHCRTPPGAKPSISLMFRVPNLRTLAMGHEGTVFASDREGKIWFGRRGQRGFVIPATSPVLGLTFLDKHVLVVTRWRARVFDLSSGKAVLQVPLPTPIETCAPASKRYLFCTLPQAPQTLRVIDLKDRVLNPIGEGHLGAVTRALQRGEDEIASTAADRRLLGWRGGSLAWSQRIKGAAYPRLLAVGRRRELWATVGGAALQLFHAESGEVASFVNHPRLKTTAAARRVGDVLAGFSNGSVSVLEDVGVGTGAGGRTWQLFESPVVQIVPLKEGFVACSEHELAFVGETVVRRPFPNLVHSTLCARGGVVYAGTAFGHIHAWSDQGAPLGQSVGAHKGGVTSLYKGPKYLVSSGRAPEIGVWTFGREEGFQRVERRSLPLSGDRASYLGPAARPDEFLLGSSRGAIVRLRFRD